MNLEDQQFLLMVEDYARKRPEIVAHIVDYAQAGLNVHMDELRERLLEMEAVALVACSKRFNGAEELIVDKIEGIKGKTGFKWDGFIEDMKAIIAKRAEKKGDV